MKKTLIATAIAGAMSFSVAAQAAPTVYGNIQLAVDLQGHKNTETTSGEDNNSVGAGTAFDNGSTLGFMGEEAMDNGLTAIYKAEFEFSAGDTKGTGKGLINGDNAYLGLKGDFGTVRVGSFDTVANDFVQDMVFTAEAVGVDSAMGGAGENQQVQYTGEFGGIKVGVSTQLNAAPDDADADSNGTISATEQAKFKAKEDKANAMQVGVVVPVGDMSISAAYDSVEGDMGVGFKMAVADMTIGAKFETGADAYTDANGNKKDETVFAASVAMNYGMGTAYALASMATEAETSAFAVGANYNVTESLYTYVEVGSGDADKEESLSGAFVGAALVF